MLTLRFRHLDPQALRLLGSSTADQRTLWSERLLGVDTLADVFGDAWSPGER